MKKTAMFILVLLVAAMAMPAAAAETEEPTGFLQMIVQHLGLRPSAPPALTAGGTHDFSLPRATPRSSRDPLGGGSCRCVTPGGIRWMFPPEADPPVCDCCYTVGGVKNGWQ